MLLFPEPFPANCEATWGGIDLSFVRVGADPPKAQYAFHRTPFMDDNGLYHSELGLTSAKKFGSGDGDCGGSVRDWILLGAIDAAPPRLRAAARRLRRCRSEGLEPTR